MKLSFFDYIRAAFSAKPIGMFVAPNHIALAGLALLGIANPGFWVLGLGLELGYLYVLSSNKRFRNAVAGRMMRDQQRNWSATLEGLLAQLPPPQRELYRQLEKRCRSILSTQNGQENAGLAAQGEGLSKLLWMFLRLQLASQSIIHMEEEAQATGDDRSSMEKRLAELEKRLENTDLAPELRNSLSGQLDILRQRVAKRCEAQDKLTYIQAELARIQEQVELIREQAALTADPATLSRRIDDISASLGGVSDWMSQQQQLFGAAEELLNEPPVLFPAPEVKQ